MTKKTKIDIETLEKAFSRIVKLPGRELDKIRVYETTTSIDILKIGITKLQGIKISLLALIIIVIIIVVVGTIFLIG